MPFVAAPNIVSVEVRALLDGQHIENRFTIDALTAVTPTIVADITNVVSNWAQATYFDQLPAQVQLSEVVGTDLTTDTGSQHSIAPESAIFGTASGAAMPNEVSLAISLRSASRGRSARGRSFVLALSRDGVTGNNVSAGYGGALVAAFATLLDAITTEGWAWVVVSYRHDGALRPGGPVYFPITNVLITDNTVDSQRKRKPGVGS